MIKKSKVVGLLLSIFLYCIFSSSVMAAPFQNGDFETVDFTGWNGDLIFSGTVDPDLDSHFTILSNAGPDNSYVAQLENDEYDWQTTLFQDFTLDTLALGWTMNITFWIKWIPTDSDQDNVSVQLQDTGYMDIVDLLDGISNSDLTDGIWVTQDITSFAQTWGGHEVELSFTISDSDYGIPDCLQIDNITFTQRAPAPVPEPGTMALLLSGLAGLGLVRKKAFKS